MVLPPRVCMQTTVWAENHFWHAINSAIFLWPSPKLRNFIAQVSQHCFQHFFERRRRQRWPGWSGSPRLGRCNPDRSRSGSISSCSRDRECCAATASLHSRLAYISGPPSFRGLLLLLLLTVRHLIFLLGLPLPSSGAALRGCAPYAPCGRAGALAMRIRRSPHRRDHPLPCPREKE